MVKSKLIRHVKAAQKTKRFLLLK